MPNLWVHSCYSNSATSVISTTSLIWRSSNPAGPAPLQGSTQQLNDHLAAFNSTLTGCQSSYTKGIIQQKRSRGRSLLIWSWPVYWALRLFSTIAVTYCGCNVTPRSLPTLWVEWRLVWTSDEITAGNPRGYDDKLSAIFPVHFGLPRTSVLGPILFNLFIHLLLLHISSIVA